MNTPLQNFQQELARTTADGALISSELNQRYLTDFSYTDGYLLVTPDKAYLLADSRYTEAAQAEVKNFEIVAVTGGGRHSVLRRFSASVGRASLHAQHRRFFHAEQVAAGQASL